MIFFSSSSLLERVADNRMAPFNYNAIIRNRYIVNHIRWIILEMIKRSDGKEKNVLAEDDQVMRENTERDRQLLAM